MYLGVAEWYLGVADFAEVRILGELNKKLLGARVMITAQVTFFGLQVTFFEVIRA